MRPILTLPQDALVLLVTCPGHAVAPPNIVLLYIDDGAWNGTPDQPGEVVWESAKPTPAGEGTHHLGITHSKRLIIFQGRAEARSETAWRSPERD